MPSSYALGDALRGSRRWDDQEVVEDSNQLPGEDDKAAWTVVWRARDALVGHYLAAFAKLEKIERAVFGEYSYFLNKELGTLTFMNEDEDSVPDRALEDESEEGEAMCDIEMEEERVEGERMYDVDPPRRRSTRLIRI
jgi:hypothetical protein